MSDRMRSRMTVVILVALPTFFAMPALAQSYPSSYLFAVSGFTSYVGPSPYNNATTGDRYFTETSFVGGLSGYKLSSMNISQFSDGTMWHGSKATTGYGWNDWIPADLSPTGNNNPWDPDRGDTGKPYLDEANKHVKLSEIFTGGNLGRILDGEQSPAAYLELYYGNGAFIQSDGVGNTPELVFVERGANSGIYVKAIKSDGTRTSTLPVSFRTSGSLTDPLTGMSVPGKGGSCGFSLDTLEINSAQSVSAVGIDLMAWGLTTNDKVIGFELWFLDNSFCAGPDLHGFTLSKQAVPEAHSLAALASFLVAGTGLLRRARRRTS